MANPLAQPLSLIPLGVSKFIERAIYYGIRTILVLYMIDTLDFNSEVALTWYTTFTAGVYFSYIFGGFIGDFFIGSRVGMSAGNLIQAMGCFIIYSGIENHLFIGLILFAIGTGLYQPNHFSAFGRSYLNHKKQLPGGVYLHYAIVNIAAFSGILFLGDFMTENFEIAFLIGAISLTLNAFLPLLIKFPIEIVKSNHSEKISKKPILLMFIAVITVSAFWTCFELTGYSIYKQQTVTVESISNLTKSFFSKTQTFGLVFLCILGYVIFSFYRFKALVILFIGACLAFFGFFLVELGFILGENSVPITYTISFIILIIAELFLSPIAYILLFKNFNPRFFGITTAALLISTYCANEIVGQLEKLISYDEHTYSIIAVILISIVLITCSIMFGIYKMKNIQSIENLDSETKQLKD